MNHWFTFAVAGFALGGCFAWVLRGFETRQLRSDARSASQACHRLEVANARTQSEYELLKSQHKDLETRLIGAQQEREKYARGYAALHGRRKENEYQRQQQAEFYEQSKKHLTKEFEVLANRIFEQRGFQLSRHNQQSMESLLKPLGEQIQHFQSRVNEVHTQTVREHENLAGQLKHLMSVGLKMGDQAHQLTQALKGDKKTTGNWGEVQLERSLQLAGLEPELHYVMQKSFRDLAGRQRLPDCIVKLPDDKHLVIDSKVSLVDWERSIASKDDSERELAMFALCAALKRHIDDLASKEYASLPQLDSPELVLMFMPIEAAYIEALKFNRDLFNEGFNKNVVLVSHTTLLPMLRTIANIWMSSRTDSQTREISDMAGDIFNKVVLLAQRLEETGKSLATTTEKYNKTVTALAGNQGLLRKINGFRSISSKAKGSITSPPPLHVPIDHNRLNTEQDGIGGHPRDKSDGRTE